MTKLVSAVLVGLFASSVALADIPPAAPTTPFPAAATPAVAPSDCEAKAVSKNGKPLAGAAKKSFMKKCEESAKGGVALGSSCEAKAIDKNGKPLAGAAKASFIKKCEAGAKSGQ